MEVEKIMPAAVKGNIEAREQVGRWLFSMLGSKLTGSFPWHDVDDIRQQTCEVVVAKMHTFKDRGPGSFGRWAREIARRKALKLWHAAAEEARKLETLVLLPRTPTLSFTSKMAKAELTQLYSECFAKLTEIEQQALIWDYEDYDDHDLAATYERSVKTIRVHRHRGYKKLVKFMRAAQRRPLPRLILPESESLLESESHVSPPMS